MSASLPVAVSFDAASGVLSSETGHYIKRLSDLAGVFSDTKAWSCAVSERDDPVVYEVREFKQDGSDLFFGTTTMQPGKVGDEFYMTRGHFHQRRDMGEFYCTQHGEGLLLLENRDGRSETVEMRVSNCAIIPPDWAHRSINTGSGPLVFTWFCNVLAGHDYGPILTRGMRTLIVERDGQVVRVPNPNFT